MRPHLGTTVDSVIATVSEAAPIFAAKGEAAKVGRDAFTATQTGLEHFLDLVGTDDPALPPHVRDVFVGLGAAEAREDRGPEVLLTTLRLASRLLLRTAVTSLSGVRPVTTEEIVDIADAITAYVDELAAATTDGFALQVREKAGEGGRLRRRLAELLLRGSAPESVVATAATAAGWRTLDAVVPVLLPLDEARDARFRYATDGIVAERVRDAVLLIRDGPRAGRAHLAQAWAGRAVVVGPRIAWDRAPEAVRLTELVAELVGGPGGPTDEPVFADDHLAALALRGEPGALTVLAARRLAPLAGLRDVQRDRLLTTLGSWLLHWGSRSEVAAELFVHPQTVTYRITQLRELLGDALDDPVARFELQLVLAYRPASVGRPGDGNAPAG